MAFLQSHLTSTYPYQLQDLIDFKIFNNKTEAIVFESKFKSTEKFRGHQIANRESGAQPLWLVKNEWNEKWEEKYSDWVKENFTKDFFVIHNFETDCADVAYALRWIFSRNNNLPAAATLAGSGINATHLTSKLEWNKLPTHPEWSKDKRFITALSWLLDHVYTKTLYKDAYPVAINKTTIRPGLINLIGGHTEVFNSVSYNEDEIPMQVLASTMPKAVREMAVRPYLDSRNIDQKDGGLLQFR